MLFPKRCFSFIERQPKERDFIDTNILIDDLNGEQQANETILAHDGMISIITKIEILVGTQEHDKEVVTSFLNHFPILELNDQIADLAVSIRKELGVKIPDAIIYASAKSEGVLLITRNTKDFSPPFPDVY